MTVLKRGREFEGEVEALAISKVGASAGGRAFACKTCNREFPSFQALGGHRASHKKPRLTGDFLHTGAATAAKPKTHECSVCGLEFPIGQALGGHMRRHSAALSGERKVAAPVTKKLVEGTGKGALCLDLNLTPYENDLKFGKMASSWLVTWLHQFDDGSSAFSGNFL